MDKEFLEQLIQEYGKSMYNEGYNRGVKEFTGMTLTNNKESVGNLFNRIMEAIEIL